MVKWQDQMAAEVRQKMRDGKGEVEILHVFRQEEMRGRCRFFARMRLKPGCSIGVHPHEKDEEAFYILRGEGQATEDGRTYTLRPGDALLTGGGSTHSIENCKPEPLEVLAVIFLVE